MSDVKDRMMAEERVQIAYNEAWQLAFEFGDEHESAFRAGWNAALTDARIVAAKDEEIRRLRDASETLTAPLDDKKRPYEGWWPVRALARKWGIYEEDVADAVDLIPLVARAALDPPQQKEGQ